METIFSLVTKPINQNVSIIRVSGPDTFELLTDVFNPSLSIKGNSAEFRKLHNKKEFIDDVIVLGFRKPNSFTGEDIIEIQSHGNMFVIKKIINMLKKLGIKEAMPGEFSKQAFLNGKLDLTQAEAINSLINAETEAMSTAATKNLNSKQSTNIDKYISMLSGIISRIQVGIDYPENKDLPEFSEKEVIKSLKEISINLTDDINQSKLLIKIDKGITMSIVGIPNAGKSTLTNALLNEERSIVTDVEGTTRDVVESFLLINGVKVTLQDTAGIRSTNDKVESIGVDKAISTAIDADILIALFDGTKDIKDQKEKLTKHIDREYIEVINKDDVKSSKGKITISAKNKEITSLLKEIEKVIENKFMNNITTSATLITDNQINSFTQVLEKINSTIVAMENNVTIDVVMFDLEDAIKELGKMKGIVVDKDYLTNLFSNFCVGK